MRRDDLIVFSLESWDEVWRRNQFLIDGLLRADASLRVLFVEPSADLLHSAVSGRTPERGRGLTAVDGYDGRLHTFQPTKLLPRMLGGAADALLRVELGRARRRLEMRRPVLWVNDPSWAMLVRRTRHPALYDMTDDWLEADRSPREHRRLVANEGVLMHRCAEVVVCSKGLEASRLRQRAVHLIPNAVDVERYRTLTSRPRDLPEGGTALYAGTLHEDRLDVDLVLRTATVLQEHGARVVLVGPNALSAEATRRLDAHGGVLILGPRPSARIPAYLQHASVLLVPHVVNLFTESLDPIKLYEYRAVGRPIVSTRVAGFRDVSDGIELADSDVFPAAVWRAVGAATASRVHDDVPDWSLRVRNYAEVLDRLRES